jgi:hypothetical protein
MPESKKSPIPKQRIRRVVRNGRKSVGNHIYPEAQFQIVFMKNFPKRKV